PAGLLRSSLGACSSSATASGGISVAVTGLADAFLKALVLTKWKLSAVALLLCGLVAIGVQDWTTESFHPPVRKNQEQALQPEPVSRKDLHGDLLPAGALARFGSPRLRAPG